MPPTASNGIGLAGFIVSIVGVLTCGVLSPFGLILSAIGLRKAPRGFAIAGVVIGAIGSIVLVIWGIAIVAALVGLKAVGGAAFENIATFATLAEARQAIEGEHRATGAIPDDATGTTIVSRFQDGWGRALIYEQQGDSFRILSIGADGVFGTADDIDLDDPNLGRLESPPVIETETTPR